MNNNTGNSTYTAIITAETTAQVYLLCLPAYQDLYLLLVVDKSFTEPLTYMNTTH